MKKLNLSLYKFHFLIILSFLFIFSFPVHADESKQELSPLARSISAMCARQALCDAGIAVGNCILIFNKAFEGKKTKITDEDAKSCEESLKTSTCEELNTKIPKACRFLGK